MAWRRTGNMPLSELMVPYIGTYMRQMVLMSWAVEAHINAVHKFVPG